MWPMNSNYGGSTITGAPNIAAGATVNLQASQSIFLTPGTILAPNASNFVYGAIVVSSSISYEYAIKDHLGNTRITYSDLDNNGVIAVPGEILQENHVACPVSNEMSIGNPFGYALDGPYMNHTNSDNLYLYNSKELNNDHGIGLYDYGARWYDASIARFPSVDPIISKFPYLTPYNYASNDPIGKIDLWGLQGVQFTEVQKGKTVRVVEADVHIAVGEKGFTNKEAASIGKTLNTAYDSKIGGQKEDFMFNVNTFEANKKSDFDVKANQINRSSKVEAADGRTSITGVVIGKGDLKDRNQGGTIENKVTISNNVYDLKHTATHEVGHFMLLGSVNQPQSKLQHENAGGIFYPGTREPDGTVVTPTQIVSKDNVIKFLENVPYKKQ